MAPAAPQKTALNDLSPAVKIAAQKQVNRVRYLGVAIWILFNSYNAAQLLQTSVNETTGYACLAAVYGLFAMASIIAPTVLSRWLPITTAIPLASSLYIVMVYCNMDPIPAPLLVSCAGVGFGAAFLWSAQSLYVQRSAAVYARLTGMTVSAANSLLNSHFYAIFASSGAVSSGMAAIFMYGVKDGVRTLFIYLTVLGSVGVLMMLLLVDAGDETTSALVRPPRCLPARWFKGSGSVAAIGAVQQLDSPAAFTSAAGRSPTPAAAASASASAGSKEEMRLELSSAAATDAAAGQAAAWEPLDSRSAAAGSSFPVAADGALRRRASSAMAVSMLDASGSADAAADGYSHSSAAGTGAPNKQATLTAAPPAPAPPAPAAAAVVPPSIPFMLRFVATSRRLRWAIPLIFYVGLASGLFNGAFLGALVAKNLGLPAVGVIGATYSIASSVGTSAWAKLLVRPTFGRRWGFVAAFTGHAVWLAFATGWYVMFGPHVGGDPASASWPSYGAAMPLLILITLVFGATDCLLWSQVPATLATMYPDGTSEAPCAMASIRLFSAAGTATSVLLSVALKKHLAWQFALTAVACAVAAGVTRRLHTHVCSLDGDAPLTSGKDTAPTAENEATTDATADEGAFDAGTAHVSSHGHLQSTTRPSVFFAGKLEATTTALVMRTGVTELETAQALQARILARLEASKRDRFDRPASPA